MLLRVFVFLLVGVVQAAAERAAVAGLLLGLVACAVVWHWLGATAGVLLGIAAMALCAVAGYLVQELLPRLVSDPDAIERRLRRRADGRERPPARVNHPDTRWSGR